MWAPIAKKSNPRMEMRNVLNMHINVVLNLQRVRLLAPILNFVCVNRAQPMLSKYNSAFPIVVLTSKQTSTRAYHTTIIVRDEEKDGLFDDIIHDMNKSVEDFNNRTPEPTVVPPVVETTNPPTEVPNKPRLTVDDLVAKGLSLDGDDYASPQGSNISTSDRMEKEAFIVEKVRLMFPGFKGLDYPRIIRLVSNSKPFSEVFSKLQEEWASLADQPLYIRDLVSDEDYPVIKEASMSIKQATAEYSATIDRIAERANTLRANALATYQEKLGTISTKNEIAWVLSLTPMDLPIGLANDLLDKLPPIENEVVDADGFTIRRMDPEVLKQKRAERKTALDRYMVRYRRWLIINARKVGLTCNELYFLTVNDINFRIR